MSWLGVDKGEVLGKETFECRAVGAGKGVKKLTLGRRDLRVGYPLARWSLATGRCGRAGDEHRRENK